eukprot:CAMPEP_0171323882 /NCGR_PEP_ID=MMETSP0816-20121228/115851_1 /TAXON_ID=420281 /ORGANISM="Proboscia inermis, Strain CCAP1064/1" /LENGTH=204 /DNA_ID=CAMNT_0011822697 /DNA_START=16 /DNA_END=630 /DNA_ORIENTATION=-
MTEENIKWHDSSITRLDRIQKTGHHSAVIWLTGLSGSGKSTVANAVNVKLFERNVSTYVLDGDNVRHGLCKDLSFSDKDREENIRRIGEVANLFLDAGFVVLTAFVSPFRADRNRVRELVNNPKKDFIEIYCNASLDVCEKRDTKGLYAKAREGLIQDLTGIGSPYEPPENADVVLNTATNSLEMCVSQVLGHLEESNIIPRID